MIAAATSQTANRSNVVYGSPEIRYRQNAAEAIGVNGESGTLNSRGLSGVRRAPDRPR
jgi:hypothetical protein